MTIIVKDTFNRPDANTLGVADTGQVWIQTGNSIGIINNSAYVPTNGDGFAVINTQLSDGVIQYQHFVYQAWTKLVWRFTDWNNCFRIEASNVLRRRNGSQSSLGNLGVTLVSGDFVTVRFENDTHEIYVNGILRLTITDDFNVNETKHGFGIANSFSRVDNFQFESLSLKEPSGTTHVLTSAINNYSDTIASLTVSKHHSLSGFVQSNASTIATLQTSKQLQSTVQSQSTSQAYLSAVKRMLSTMNGTSSTQASLTVQSVEGTAHALSSSIQANTDIFAQLNTNKGMSGESRPQSQINGILRVNKPLTSVISVQSYTGAYLGFGEQIISYVYLKGYRELDVYLQGKRQLEERLNGKREIEVHLKGSV